MYLGGQAGERGYAMAAVLISVALMSIVMTALLPVWRQQMQREREAELAFRGEQYARAIYLFQRSNGGMNPPSLDALVQGRYIRKKYKDPTNGEDFLPLSVGANQPGPQGGGAGERGGGPGQRGGGPGQRGGGPSPGLGGSQPGGQRGAGPSPGLGGQQPGGVQGGGGVITVVSQNKDASIRVYNGATHYNEWRFMYNARGQRGNPQGGFGGPGQDRPGAPGVGSPGRGGRRGGPGAGGPGRGGRRGGASIDNPGRRSGPGRGGGQ